MRVVGVAGQGVDEVAGTLVRRLGAHGRVARVRREDASADGGATVAAADATTDYVLSGERSRVSGPSRPLDAVLDGLAPDHEYAVVTGYPDARIPHVVVGDAAHDGEVIARLAEPASDVAAAVEAVGALQPHETLESLVARAKDSPEADRAGAIATFTGRVRARDDPDDPETTHLEFETYEGVAEERMAAIREELEAREGVFEVVMHHKTGVVDAGEDIVFVVVLAGHRAEAFATVEDGINRLKSEVPLFKKEVTLDGEFWAHQRE